MDEPSSSSSSSSVFISRSPAIDRHNPIIRDSRRSSSSSIPVVLSTLHSPSTTKPLPSNNKKKNKKKNSSSNNPHEGTDQENRDQAKKKLPDDDDEEINVKIGKNRWSRTKAAYGEFISPPGSTRYLLSEQLFLKDVVSARNTDVVVKTNTSTEESPPPYSPGSPDLQLQVVVLRVSLHCRGCERKMRKHIARMKGVTSFDIDFVAKKVTVTGKVTPLEVLSSISKVKNAQLWPPTLSNYSPASADIIKRASGAT